MSEHEGFTFQRLEDKRSQEIFWLVVSDFLAAAPAPTRREVKECSLVIDTDGIEVDITLPENLNMRCTKLSPFIYWAGQKKEILLIDYERIDKYLKRNQEEVTEDGLFSYYYFDAIVDIIQEKMAELKPQIAKYLKNYQTNQILAAQRKSTEILNVCQPLLKASVRTGFLRDLICKLMDDKDIREEALAKLCSAKARNKYICEIVAALDCFGVFKKDVTRSVLAKTLSLKMGSVSIRSADYYIKVFKAARSGNLYDWMKANIDDLKAHAYNPLQVLMSGIVK